MTGADEAGPVVRDEAVVSRSAPVGRVLAGLGALVLGALTVVAWSSGGGSDRDAGLAEEGARLFAAKGCATCHNGPGTTARVGVGPNLADLVDVADQRREGLSARDYVVESILAPDAFTVPGYPSSGPMSGMPTLDVSTGEVDALVSYLLDG
ncbi:MAG: cytochrome c [Actinomycetota bacterium]|nr:cytochrome c [Actinomycetota bacterium]